MSEGVRGDALGDAGFADGIANLAGHGVVVKVVAGDPAGVQISSPRQKSVPFHTN